MSLRIISQQSARNLESMGGAGGTLEDTYISRLGKLIPGEAVASYPLFLNGAKTATATTAAPSGPTESLNSALASGDWRLIALTSWIVLLVVIILRWRATKGPDGKAQWQAVAISAVAFVILVYMMEGSFGISNMAAMYTATPLPFADISKGAYNFLASLGLFAWTLVAPALYTGGNDGG